MHLTFNIELDLIQICTNYIYIWLDIHFDIRYNLDTS